MDSIGKRWAANVAGAEGAPKAEPKEERAKTTAIMEPVKKSNPARQQYKQGLLNSLSGQGGQQPGQNPAMAAMAGGM